MAALVIVPANVSLASGAHAVDCVAGEGFNAGEAVYQRASDGRWLKAQCDGTPEEAGAVDYGVALFTASGVGARGAIAKAGAVVNVGAAVAAAGVSYWIGATAGSLVPAGDLLSTNKASIVAIGKSTSQLVVVHHYDAAFVLA